MVFYIKTYLSFKDHMLIALVKISDLLRLHAQLMVFSWPSYTLAKVSDLGSHNGWYYLHVLVEGFRFEVVLNRQVILVVPHR